MPVFRGDEICRAGLSTKQLLELFGKIKLWSWGAFNPLGDATTAGESHGGSGSLVVGEICSILEKKLGLFMWSWSSRGVWLKLRSFPAVTNPAVPSLMISEVWKKAETGLLISWRSGSPKWVNGSPKSSTGHVAKFIGLVGSCCQSGAAAAGLAAAVALNMSVKSPW